MGLLDAEAQSTLSPAKVANRGGDTASAAFGSEPSTSATPIVAATAPETPGALSQAGSAADALHRDADADAQARADTDANNDDDDGADNDASLPAYDFELEDEEEDADEAEGADAAAAAVSATAVGGGRSSPLWREADGVRAAGSARSTPVLLERQERRGEGAHEEGPSQAESLLDRGGPANPSLPTWRQELERDQTWEREQPKTPAVIRTAATKPGSSPARKPSLRSLAEEEEEEALRALPPGALTATASMAAAAALAPTAAAAAAPLSGAAAAAKPQQLLAVDAASLRLPASLSSSSLLFSPSGAGGQPPRSPQQLHESVVFASPEASSAGVARSGSLKNLSGRGDDDGKPPDGAMGMRLRQNREKAGSEGEQSQGGAEASLAGTLLELCRTPQESSLLPAVTEFCSKVAACV
eukprot:jgi/Mesen1/9450/ME000626S08700